MNWRFWEKKHPWAAVRESETTLVAEQMHRFLADVKALRIAIDECSNADESFHLIVAYDWAKKGAAMACKDYVEALKKDGLISR